MNPFSLQKQRFRKGRPKGNGSFEKNRVGKRSSRNLVHKSVRLKESYGAIGSKKKLTCSLLNVDGLSDASLADVRDVLARKQPDLCVILESKIRFEESGPCLDVPGYEVAERRRSDFAGDRGGGGIAVYTRKRDGLVFKSYDPDILNPEHMFVRTERLWTTVQSAKGKTAVCAVYAGFQAADDRHGVQNEILYSVLKTEIIKLRTDGYRVVLLGDFNGHVGSDHTVGIVGNHDVVNRNGRRFLDFLSETHCAHVNGCPNLCQGLWTRQRGGVSTVLDYCVVGREHLSSVLSMLIDDQGVFGGGSDHNWVFLDLVDSFVRKLRISNLPNKKKSWNIRDSQDWTSFEASVDTMVGEIDDTALDDATLANKIAGILMQSGLSEIGLRSNSSKSSIRATSLPKALVDEIKLKRSLEKVWKSKCSSFSSLPILLRTDQLQTEMVTAESSFLEQVAKVNASFLDRGKAKRSKILQQCSENSVEATRCFWSHVNKTAHKSSEIDAVLSPTTGVLHCAPEEIIDQVEKHLVSVFNGSLDPIEVTPSHDDHGYAGGPGPATATSDPATDHPYSSSASPRLPESDGSTSIQTDPNGWLDADFSLDDVIRSVKKLKAGKAVGVDHLPSEFILHAGVKFWRLLTILYNRIKKSGSFPPGWNRGRVVLVHKKDMRELLGNYRPLTVIISLSGLYSKLLNERLTSVVEHHGLLGQIQNGFRKGRSGSDNSFVLDTILWKSKSMRKKVHLAFIDLTKVWVLSQRFLTINLFCVSLLTLNRLA